MAHARLQSPAGTKHRQARPQPPSVKRCNPRYNSVSFAMAQATDCGPNGVSTESTEALQPARRKKIPVLVAVPPCRRSAVAKDQALQSNTRSAATGKHQNHYAAMEAHQCQCKHLENRYMQEQGGSQINGSGPAEFVLRNQINRLACAKWSRFLLPPATLPTENRQGLPLIMLGAAAAKKQQARKSDFRQSGRQGAGRHRKDQHQAHIAVLLRPTDHCLACLAIADATQNIIFSRNSIPDNCRSSSN